MKVLFVAADPKPERWTSLIRQYLPEAEVIVWTADAPGCEADYAIVWQPSPMLFERERQLKAVFNLGAGVDGLLHVPNLPRHIPVVRLEDAGMSAQMAEYVVHYVVEASRDMARYRAQQAQHEWRMSRPSERAEWPIGVLGLGQIGRRVARTLADLDYPVAGWARTAHVVGQVEVFAGREQLNAFLSRTRVLVNALPLTDETRDLINYDALTSLERGAVLINVGRGEHVVDVDLMRAIANGHVRQAVLDVFREEPLPRGHPYWTMPQVTITPHISARTLRHATIAQIVDKVRALEAGDAITGVVDVEHGY